MELVGEPWAGARGCGRPTTAELARTGCAREAPESGTAGAREGGRAEGRGLPVSDWLPRRPRMLRKNIRGPPGTLSRGISGSASLDSPPSFSTHTHIYTQCICICIFVTAFLFILRSPLCSRGESVHTHGARHTVLKVAGYGREYSPHTTLGSCQGSVYIRIYLKTFFHRVDIFLTFFDLFIGVVSFLFS